MRLIGRTIDQPVFGIFLINQPIVLQIRPINI